MEWKSFAIVISVCINLRRKAQIIMNDLILVISNILTNRKEKNED